MNAGESDAYDAPVKAFIPPGNTSEKHTRFATAGRSLPFSCHRDPR